VARQLASLALYAFKRFKVAKQRAESPPAGSRLTGARFGPVALNGLLCGALSALIVHQPIWTARAQSSQVTTGTNTPAEWERLAEGAFENKGVARIERLGDRWVLSVVCRGTHTTYLDETSIDLTQYADRYVSARYHYVERTVPDPKCFRAPCGPIRERRLSLERVTVLPITVQAAREKGRRCD
jgi:hypothetical protein